VPPSLAGLNRDYLLKQMQDFRDGKRPATIMHQHAKGYTDEQLALIAGYFAAVSPGRAAAAPAVR
jgi:cytochrome c553